MRKSNDIYVAMDTWLFRSITVSLNYLRLKKFTINKKGVLLMSVYLRKHKHDFIINFESR